jgi:hypothetical protein
MKTSVLSIENVLTIKEAEKLTRADVETIYQELKRQKKVKLLSLVAKSRLAL